MFYIKKIISKCEKESIEVIRERLDNAKTYMTTFTALMIAIAIGGVKGNLAWLWLLSVIILLISSIWFIRLYDSMHNLLITKLKKKK